MARPKLSLIVSVYNKAPFLRRCLDSVAKQMTDGVQVIVIDDASTDGSDNIMLEYDQFDRLYLLENGGVSRARNEGLDYAKGKAVAFLDADDALEDGAIRKMLRYAEDVDKWPIIQFGQSRHYNDGRVTEYCAESRPYDVPDVPRYWMMVRNKVYSRKFIVAHSVRFDETMGFGEDECFNIDLISEAGGLIHTKSILVQHHMDDLDSICRGGSVKCEKAQKLYSAVYRRMRDTKNEDVKKWLKNRLDMLRQTTMFRKAGFTTKGLGKYDVVYLLKNSPVNEELRYSLRSVDCFFGHNKVWFVGGQPDWLVPDERLALSQHDASKYKNVRNMLVEVCKNDEMTDDFWLFNDDFFILTPFCDDVPNYYNGTLQEQIKRCEEADGGITEYTANLRHLVETLERAGLPTLNYSIHKPMLINRRKALEVLEKFPDESMFRALYGNYWGVGDTDEVDCKIRRTDRGIREGRKFVSTQDESFEFGIVGRQLRDMFSEQSRFER